MVLAFEHVLVLMMGLTVPQSNPEEIEVVCKFCTGVIAGVIAKEAVWRSPLQTKDWKDRMRDLVREMGLMWTM